jgi:hypothetical protein
MALNAPEIKFTFIACLADKLFPIEEGLIINRNVKFAIFLIAIFILIARATEIQK